jgi:pectate disaccharide-lyase
VHSGNYWHVEGIDFARSAGNTKGYTIGGSHNTIENVRTFENGDTGLQISRTDASEEDKSKWPSYNLILNSISFDNSDPAENNADGFAAKLTSGDGNIFRGTVAYNNIDDGWDLYTKVGTGAIGAVLIENSIAFNNGTLSNGHMGSGDKNGFKLGGEGVHVPHVIKNSLAFGNGTYGFTSNSNPGAIAENNISADNGTNLGFTTYGGIPTDFTIDGFISIKTSGTSKDSYPTALGSDRNYLFNGSKTVNKSGDELSAEQSTDILGSFEDLFNFDDRGRILSVKENQWAAIWDTYDEVVGPEESPSIDVTELEELITQAKAISNDKKKYTEPSFVALQDAIEVAEAALETIATEEELNEAVTALTVAIDGLKKATGNGNGNGKGNGNGNGNGKGNGNR